MTAAQPARYCRPAMEAPVIAEIELEALRGNLQACRRRVPVGTSLCPAVKADAYGHGVAHVLPVLAGAGVRRVAVANLDEALALRGLGWTGGIQCFGPMLSTDSEHEQRQRALAAVAGDIALTIQSLPEAQVLSAAAAHIGRPARAEIKVDTGMGRMGLLPENAAGVAQTVQGCAGVLLEGIYTHLATADEPDLTFAHEQLTAFAWLREHLREKIPHVAFHAANSAAIFRLPEAHLDRVRPGLALYGYWTGPEDERPPDLRPSLRVVSRLTAVRALPAGHAVGYGRSFITPAPCVIGIVPIGYADGYRRLLGNQAVMTLESRRGLPRHIVPVVGRVSMDQTAVDLSHAGEARPGDRIVVIDNDPSAAHSVEALAHTLATIPYEVTCLLGQRVRRVAV